MNKEQKIQDAFECASDRYQSIGVVVNKALEKLQNISISLHCWQADDVSGFENSVDGLTGGIQVTGNYPGKARNMDELRCDVIKATSMIAGSHRLSLHEIYGDFNGKKIDRNEVAPEHFQSWMDWAKASTR